jgi:hypothetical protein
VGESGVGRKQEWMLNVFLMKYDIQGGVMQRGKTSDWVTWEECGVKGNRDILEERVVFSHYFIQKHRQLCFNWIIYRLLDMKLKFHTVLNTSW